MISAVPVRGTDGEEAARLKGDARMVDVLHAALWDRIGEPAEAIILSRGARRWRVPAARIAERVAEVRERGGRYGTGRDLLSHRTPHVLLRQMQTPCPAAD